MSQTKALPQTKETLLKSYQKRLKDDIRSMADNYFEIVRIGKTTEDELQVSRATQGLQDQFETEVRAASMVRAAESMLKLVSDVKQFLILNDFMQVNEAITTNSKICLSAQSRIDAQLLAIRDDLSTDLYELEDEYYTSAYK